MPFIRYNRDKRGYETTLVLHAYRTPQGTQQNRVLYLFRSSSAARVGRQALDEEVVEALEHTHPDLTFDWPGLLRDRVESHSAPRPRPRRPAGREGGAGRQPGADARPAAPVEVVVEDQSLLGRTLGASEAQRLRRRYEELVQRIARRARTPEERDRLSERAGRLNPDDWADEESVRTRAQGIDAELDAVAAELPERRRGRRGGRRRALEGAGNRSAIMDSHGEVDALDTREVAGEGRASDAGGNDGGLGPDADAAGADDIPGPV